MAYWLLKSEPDCFSIDALNKLPKKTTCWDGVRNYQARNMIRDAMQPGDLAFFYHSNCKPPGIVGIVAITSQSYPDHTAQDPMSDHFDPASSSQNPRWYMMDVKFVQKFKRTIGLDEIKSSPSLKSMQVAQKGNRLSITPVTASEWKSILAMESKV